jgi:hypothetical protein
MKINLAAKNDDIKDNYPAGDFSLHLKGKINKVNKQKNYVYKDS